jgi:hypothetical protein
LAGPANGVGFAAPKPGGGAPYGDPPGETTIGFPQLAQAVARGATVIPQRGQVVG